jgi:hypothetical protein
MKVCGGVYSSTILDPGTIEVKGQVDALAASLPGKKPRVLFWI